MVVWRGKGWIVMLLAFLAVAIPLEISHPVYRGLAQLGLFTIFGLCVWFLGNRWNVGQDYHSQAAGKFDWRDIFESGYENHTGLLDGDSPSHSFTLVKVQYWGFVFPVVGLVCLFIGLFTGL